MWPRTAPKEPPNRHRSPDAPTVTGGAGFLVLALGADSGEDLDLGRWVDEGRFAAERSIREAENLARFHENLRGLAERRRDLG